MSRQDPHVIIVGGGVIGVCCAYFLARRGARVTVVERDEIGTGASYGNAGTIVPGHPPLNKPGRLQQAFRSLFDPLSPLYVAPRADPALLHWLWVFSRHCGHTHLQYTLRALAPLGHITARLFEQLVTNEGLDCGYRHQGYYEVYLTEGALSAAEREAEAMRDHGYRPESLTGAELRAREPALNEQVLGGLFFPEAATIHPYRFVLALAERARRYGAVFEVGREVTDIVVSDAGKLHGILTSEKQEMAADYVVFAAGAYGGGLARRLGCRLPIQAAKGYHLDREPKLGGTPALQQACLLGETSVFCTPMDGFVRFAGTLELSGVNHELRQPRLQQLAKAATRYFNNMGEAKARSEWCGLRPCLPDGLPVVGPIPQYPNALLATGHAMAGLTLGPVTGQLIAEYILDGKPAAPADALRPDRF